MVIDTDLCCCVAEDPNMALGGIFSYVLTMAPCGALVTHNRLLLQFQISS